MNGFANDKARSVHFFFVIFFTTKYGYLHLQRYLKRSGTNVFKRNNKKGVVCQQRHQVAKAAEKKTRDTRADRETDVAALPPPPLSPHPASPSRVGSAGPTIRTGKSYIKKAGKKIPNRDETTGVRMSGRQQAKAKLQARSLFYQAPFQKKNFQLYQP